MGSGNPDLKPEDARSVSAGVVIVPPGLPGLTVSLDYYRLTKENAILQLNLPTVVQNELLLPGRVVRGPPNPGDPPGLPGPITFLDIRPVNSTRFETAGWDLSASFAFSIGRFGEMTVAAIGTHVSKFARQLIAGSTQLDLIGQPTLGGPLKNKASMTTSWKMGHVSAAITSRYLSSYLPTNPTLEGSKISSSVEHDLLLAYAFNGAHTWLRGTTATLGVLNLFDKRPPFEATTGYSQFNDPLQRFVYLRITKKF